MKRRPYQDTAIRETIRQLFNHPLLVCPTGGGKTFMGVEIANELKGKAIWIAHRRELIDQAYKHLSRYNIPLGVIMAGEPENKFAKIHVASIQTLNRRSLPDDLKVVFIDEAHHATSSTYTKLFERNIPVIGFTATPFRLDGKPLDMFGEIVEAASTQQLLDDGYLISPRVYTHGNLNLTDLKITAGDYNKKQLGEAIDRPDLVGDIFGHWVEHAANKLTVCFATNIEHSKHIVEIFTAHNIPSAHIDANTPQQERDRILQNLREGKIKVVSNVMVLTEGWDLPALECCIIARPTASLNLHLQMVGRVLRPAEGKDRPVVLDHSGNHHRHGGVAKPLKYSLAGKVKSAGQEALGLRMCGNCFVMYSNGKKECPECGSIPPPPSAREIDHRNGVLSEYDEGSFEYQQAWWEKIESEREGRKPYWSIYRFEERFGFKPLVIDGELINQADKSQENKKRVYEHFVDIANAKRFSRGWASHKFKAIFGCWPKGFVKETHGERMAQMLTERYRMSCEGRLK